MTDQPAVADEQPPGSEAQPNPDGEVATPQDEALTRGNPGEANQSMRPPGMVGHVGEDITDPPGGMAA